MSVLPYCADPLVYHRRKTRAIRVGDGPSGPVFIGGDHPICVQSMTTTPTRDVDATVKQVRKLVDAGCQLVRITAPTKQDADALGEIRKSMDQNGIRVPLVADIHFAPQAAMRAADFVEKVRINPGNFADRKRFQQYEYTDAEYEEELQRIAETFVPFVKKMKELGRCMRIGTNHGSLSDRIMNRFGDTPEGMVESALEYIRICEAEGFREIVLSMKASKPELMIAANRLLAARLDALGMDYPIHLGVTEAGDGEDGRIKSAIGIGALLQDGVGDTIRVSLTEDPEFEIPVAMALADAYSQTRLADTGSGAGVATSFDDLGFDPYSFSRHETDELALGEVKMGAHHAIRVDVVTQMAEVGPLTPELPALTKRDQALEVLSIAADGKSTVPALREFCDGIRRQNKSLSIGVKYVDDYDGADIGSLFGLTDRISMPLAAFRASANRSLLLKPIKKRPVVEIVIGTDQRRFTELWLSLTDLLGGSDVPWPDGIILAFRGRRLIPAVRFIQAQLKRAGRKAPIQLIYASEVKDAVLEAAVELGTLLSDGIGDSIGLETADSLEDRLRISYNILQGAGKRITKTEYISCPSCGRTLFDLQTTTERIKASTGHLKDVRIAVMGCVVNGPGEMADADFGYVGSAPGLIQLYVGKTCVERGVPEAEADRKLIELIKSHGRWVDPPRVAS